MIGGLGVGVGGKRWEGRVGGEEGGGEEGEGDQEWITAPKSVGDPFGFYPKVELYLLRAGGGPKTDMQADRSGLSSSCAWMLVFTQL